MTQKLNLGRDHAIDIVRGIAIVTMVGANLAVFLPEPHSFFLRVYSSFAAPTFICLAGMMVALSVDRNMVSKHSFMYFFKRGLFLLAVASLIDILAWKSVPFINVDVLYLIGFSLPILFVCAFYQTGTLLLLSLAIFLATPVLQYYFGYREIPLALSLINPSSFSAFNWSIVLKHWLIDGWFPLFPWLGYGIFGVALGKLRWYSTKYRLKSDSTTWLLAALLFTVVGALTMYQVPGPLDARS